MATITFLISSYNRREVLLQTLGQLDQIGQTSGLATETIVVDNASTDGSADAVAQRFPTVRLIRGTRNRGACAKNEGLKLASGKFIVFLDDDSYPSVDSLHRMLRHFTADSSLGAAVFNVRLPDGSRECSAYPNVFIGCGTGFRRKALDEVGGLPDDFFMQAEEYDLSLRLLDAGWNVQRFEDMQVEHLKTPGARVPTRTTRLDVRNNLTLIARHFPNRWVLPFALAWMRRYRWIARSKGWRHELAFWRGLGEGLLRSFQFKKRRPIGKEAFERFSRIEEITANLAASARLHQARTVLLLDVGKNALAYRVAAQACGLRVVAIADDRLAKPGRRFGSRVVTDRQAMGLQYDLAVVANVSPVHAELRAAQWRRVTGVAAHCLVAPTQPTVILAVAA